MQSFDLAVKGGDVPIPNFGVIRGADTGYRVLYGLRKKAAENQ